MIYLQLLFLLGLPIAIGVGIWNNHKAKVTGYPGKHPECSQCRVQWCTTHQGPQPQRKAH